jgi:hypothetical protein
MYKQIKLSLTSAQAKKAVTGKSIRIKADQIDSGDSTLFLHPTNYKIIMKAKKLGRGATIELSAGEIEATKMSDLEGTGVFDFLKKGYDWVKGNWGSIKPVLSAVGDAVATIAPQTAPVRGLVKGLTGVGITKGSQEAKEKMAMLRSMRGKKKTKGLGNASQNAIGGSKGSGLYL